MLGAVSARLGLTADLELLRRHGLAECDRDGRWSLVHLVLSTPSAKEAT